MGRLAGLSLVLVTAACASAPLRKADMAALAAAEANVLEGCYDCLVEARDAYARLATGKRRPLVVHRLFEAATLVALRERELAIDNGPALEQARALAAELPAIEQASRYVDVIDLIPGHEAGWPRRRSRDFRRLSPSDLDARLAALDAGAFSAVFKRYMSLSLDCTQLAARSRGGPGRPPGMPELPADAAPLLRYRAATCHGSWARPLAALKQDVPRFVDAAVFLGRLELRSSSSRGGRKARALLQEAYGRLSKSPAVTFLNGSASQAAGDRANALRYFDETLVLEPLHEDALLGRTVCLSQLERHREGIDAATRILDLNTPDVGDAYYWRAWNRHKLKELAEARSDIDRARTLQVATHVLTLAGIIEYEQDDLSLAAADLAQAVEMNAANCAARWYQALVELKRHSWGTSAGYFADATTCYDTAAGDTEAQLEQMRRATDVDEEFRAQQIAGFQAAVAEDRSQASAAAYNAAVNFLRSHDVAKAESYADRAALDAERAPRVEELRKRIRERR